MASNTETGLTAEEESFLRKLMAAFHTAIATRAKAGAFGEITLKVTQRKGRVEGSKILEESILRPSD